jgi:valyl-tRNA synthetase
VTPAHDPNDYACWTRHPEIAVINILNPDGTVNNVGGPKYAGLDRLAVRDLVVADMEELGHFVGRADRDIPLPFSDRSKTPIEPYLSDQWFVSMADRDGKPGLAQQALDAVRTGRVQFHPERYAKTYADWLGEKRDWCVSRQLWWGHRIPVWSRKFVSNTEAAAYELVHGKRLGFKQPGRAVQVDLNANVIHVCLLNDADAAGFEAEGFAQSDDVLDTWFSSALWPFSTLGWPDDTADLRKYYPTSTLVTSRDIITLWVARMVMMGLYNLGEVPFKDVYITPKVLDGFGEGMSKSKGNGVDPLDIIELYGTDALRYYVTSIAGETQDTRLPISNVCPHCGNLVPVKAEHLSMRTKKLTCPSCKKAFRPGGPWPAADPELPTAKQASDRFEVGRNFANKLWNATRFIIGMLEGYTPAAIDTATLAVEDRWIVSRLATTTAAVTTALDHFRFAEATRLIYEFTWSEFCDWYLEMSKSRRGDAVCQRVLVGVVDGVLRLAHPVMPFVTESLWAALNESAPVRGLPTPSERPENACVADWPDYPADLAAPETEAAIGRMQELVRAVREVRNRYQIDPKAKVELVMPAADAKRFAGLETFVTDMAGLSAFTVTPTATKPKQSASIVRGDFSARVLLEGLIDPTTEAKRLDKQIADARKQAAALTAKLANASYVANAPPEVVQESRDKVAELTRQAESLEESLRDLSS